MFCLFTAQGKKIAVHGNEIFVHSMQPFVHLSVCRQVFYVGPHAFNCPKHYVTLLNIMLFDSCRCLQLGPFTFSQACRYTKPGLTRDWTSVWFGFLPIALQCLILQHLNSYRASMRRGEAAMVVRMTHGAGARVRSRTGRFEPKTT